MKKTLYQYTRYIYIYIYKTNNHISICFKGCFQHCFVVGRKYTNCSIYTYIFGQENTLRNVSSAKCLPFCSRATVFSMVLSSLGTPVCRVSCAPSGCPSRLSWLPCGHCSPPSDTPDISSFLPSRSRDDDGHPVTELDFRPLRSTRPRGRVPYGGAHVVASCSRPHLG